MKFNRNKYTPPFRVGRKQGRAVLDAKGLEVIFMHDEDQAQLYCDYLNDNIKEFYQDDLRILVHKSASAGYYLVTWEDAYGDCGADILTFKGVFKKYPWLKAGSIK